MALSSMTGFARGHGVSGPYAWTWEIKSVNGKGLDVRLRILEYLQSTLGEKYRPNELLKKLVSEGRLGRKSGRGVYDYERQKPQG